MTLDSTTSKVQYTQAGTTTEWPVTFKFLDNEDLIVITTVDGVDTTLVLDTDYTVTGAGDDAGGTVTISPAVASGTRVTIYREVDLDQPTELTTAGGWFPKVHEAVFDRLTMQIQQVQEAVDRSVKIQVTSTDTPDNIISALYTARDDASASAVSAAGSADTATTQAGLAADEATAAAQSAQEAQAAADSIGVMQSRGVLLTGQDTITLTWTYNPALKNVAVFLDGVKQDADTALIYTDANTITLTEAVTEATNWEVISVTLAGDSTLSGYVDQCQDIVNNAALSNLPIGALITVTGSTPAAGTVAAQGQLVSRSAFPDLWAFAQASGNISVDDASWTKGQYSPGDGSTTFRVPNLQDQFIRGASGTRAVGHGEEDAFQGHWHDIWTSGAGTVTTGGAGRLIDGPGSAATNLNSPSDRVRAAATNGVNGTPRTADETRPKNVAYLICIKAYDVISDPNVLNAVEVVNSIAAVGARVTPCLSADEYIHIRDEKPSGTSGGSTSSAAWHTRDLNTVKTNTIAGATLTSNKIALPEGRYYISASAPAAAVTRHRVALYDVTNSTYTMLGVSCHTPSSGGDSTRSTMVGMLDIPAGREFEVRTYCTASYPTNGLGFPVTISGQPEIYTEVEIWKIG